MKQSPLISQYVFLLMLLNRCELLSGNTDPSYSDSKPIFHQGRPTTKSNDPDKDILIDKTHLTIMLLHLTVSRFENNFSIE